MFETLQRPSPSYRELRKRRQQGSRHLKGHVEGEPLWTIGPYLNKPDGPALPLQVEDIQSLPHDHIPEATMACSAELLMRL
jgi:hypothetical protein